MKLGERLNTLAAMVPSGSRIADVGTDHAYLPLHLVSVGKIKKAVAIDVNPGPFALARDAVARSGLADRIEVRLGDGLRALSPGEVDVAIMAGMGGITMIKIMEESAAVLKALTCLVLQPMVAVPQVRRWLQTHGWCIIDEDIVNEEGHLYELLVAEPGQTEEQTYQLSEVGPVLWKRNHPLLAILLRERLEVLYYILEQMDKSPLAQSDPKYREHKALTLELEAKLVCLQLAKL